MWGANSSPSKAQIVLTFPRGNGTQSQPLRIEFVPKNNRNCQEQLEQDNNEQPSGIVPRRQSQIDLERNKEKCREMCRKIRQSADQQRNGNTQSCNCMQERSQQACPCTGGDNSRDSRRKSREISSRACDCQKRNSKSFDEKSKEQPRRVSRGSQSSLWKREDKSKNYNNASTVCSIVNKKCNIQKTNDPSFEERQSGCLARPKPSRSSNHKKGIQPEAKNQSSSGKGRCPLSVEIRAPMSSAESPSQGKSNCDYLCSEFRVCAPPPPPDINQCQCNMEDDDVPDSQRACAEALVKVIAGDSCITLCSNSGKSDSKKKKKKKDKKKETRKELPVCSRRRTSDSTRPDDPQDDSACTCSKKAKITFSSDPDCRCAESFRLSIVAKRDNESSEDGGNQCKVTEQVLQLPSQMDRSCQMDICLPGSAKSKALPCKPTNRIKKPPCPPQNTKSPCRSLPIPISKQALNYMPTPRICELAQPLIRDTSKMNRPLPTPISPCALSYVASERIKELAEPRPDLSTLPSYCSFKDCNQFKDFDGDSQDEEDELLVVNCEDCGGNGSERLFIIQCIPK